MERISKKIELYLKGIIFSETMNSDTPLPSEHFLATKFKVSRQTARNELVKLLNKGFLIAKKGAGYFINHNISFAKIKTLSDEYKPFKRVICEIDHEWLKIIIDKLNFKLTNFDDYFGYQKTYFSEQGKAFVIIKSYILKAKFVKIDLVKINYSLMDFMIENNVNVSSQLNKIELELPTDHEKEIFQSDKLVPTIYGVLINEDGDIVEIFQRKVVYNKFSYSFIKQR